MSLNSAQNSLEVFFSARPCIAQRKKKRTPPMLIYPRSITERCKGYQSTKNYIYLRNMNAIFEIGFVCISKLEPTSNFQEHLLSKNFLNSLEQSSPEKEKQFKHFSYTRCQILRMLKLNA